jgi:hypothetical protein
MIYHTAHVDFGPSVAPYRYSSLVTQFFEKIVVTVQ